MLQERQAVERILERVDKGALQQQRLWRAVARGGGGGGGCGLEEGQAAGTVWEGKGGTAERCAIWKRGMRAVALWTSRKWQEIIKRTL